MRCTPKVKVNYHFSLGGFILTKISTNTKLQAVNEYISGNSSYNVVARKFDMNTQSLQVMVTAYRIHGTNIFFNKPIVTGPFRVKIVEWHLANNASLIQTAAQFGYLGTERIRQWTKIYSQTGRHGLLSIQKGRPVLMNIHNEKPEPKLTLEEENILLKQAILRKNIEIDALKLLASMEQKDQRIRDSRK